MLWLVFALFLVLALYVVLPRLLRSLIKKRLQNYTHTVVEPNPSAPEKLTEERRVAVIGGGVAGLSVEPHLAVDGDRPDHVDVGRIQASHLRLGLHQRWPRDRVGKYAQADVFGGVA